MRFYFFASSNRWSNAIQSLLFPLLFLSLARPNFKGRSSSKVLGVWILRLWSMGDALGFAICVNVFFAFFFLFYFPSFYTLGCGRWKDAQPEGQVVIVPYEEIFVRFFNIHNSKCDLLLKTSWSQIPQRSLKIVCHAPLGLKSLKY